MKENYFLLTKYLAGLYLNDDNLSLACPYPNFLFNVITRRLTYIYRNIYCFCVESKRISNINIMEKNAEKILTLFRWNCSLKINTRSMLSKILEIVTICQRKFWRLIYLEIIDLVRTQNFPKN